MNKYNIENYLNDLSFSESPTFTIPETIESFQPPHRGIYEFSRDYVCQYSRDISKSNKIAEATANITIETTVVGIDNSLHLYTGIQNDFLIGIASASVKANSQARARSTAIGSTANSRTFAAANISAEAVGISNKGRISTDRGNDTIFGFAQTNARSNVSTTSFTKSEASNNSTAIAQGDSVGLINVLAIGIDNTNQIMMGKGDDRLIAIAQTAAKSQTSTKIITEAFNLDLGIEATNEFNQAFAQTNAFATSIIESSTFGLFNSGDIFLGKGQDLIFGAAISEGVSDANSIADSRSEAVDLAVARADAEAIAIVDEDTVGIVNTGKIYTAKGDDKIIGLAFNNQTEALSDAPAEAVARAIDTDTDSNSIAIADTNLAIAIGIDNSEGVIQTGSGQDSIVAYGDTVGLLGGRIFTERGDDRLTIYGGVIGAENSQIYTGAGNDYFQAAIGELDPLTGKFERDRNQDNSLVNARVFGGKGNDTFEIGNFGGESFLYGGRGFDTLRLMGDFDRYQFSADPCNNCLTIEDSGSVLTVKNVEAIYLGDSDLFYTASDFA